MIRKIKLYFKLKYAYNCLFDSVLQNIRLRTPESEFTYRYFRLQHSMIKNQYSKLKWINN